MPSNNTPPSNSPPPPPTIQPMTDPKADAEVQLIVKSLDRDQPGGGLPSGGGAGNG